VLFNGDSRLFFMLVEQGLDRVLEIGRGSIVGLDHVSLLAHVALALL